MELASIYALLDRFDASEIEEMELDMEGVRLRLKHGSRLSGQRSNAPAEQSSFGSAPETEQTAAGAEKNRKSSCTEVKAPLVGRFYLAPSPDADPFVVPGQPVKKGQVIGIIEAMKMMNEIAASADGIVSEILVSDGELVEYDQTLITIM